MDILVGEGFCTTDRWKRCGINSKFGSVGLSGGRIRTATFTDVFVSSSEALLPPPTLLVMLILLVAREGTAAAEGSPP